ncbi:MAG: lysophospholipid acyltransferase family protein [Pirellulales bacterium]
MTRRTGGEISARMLRPPVGLFARIAADLEVRGHEFIPKVGPVLLVPNHVSLIDPPIVSLVASRYTRFLALDELFGRSRIFDVATKHFGTIPMSRVYPPLSAMKTSLQHLGDGGALAIFPEGRRAAYWGESTSKRGAAWLAIGTNAPILPIVIQGTEGTLSLTQPRVKRVSIRVTVRPPIDPSGFLSCVAPTVGIMKEWERSVSEILGERQPLRE